MLVSELIKKLQEIQEKAKKQHDLHITEGEPDLCNYVELDPKIYVDLFKSEPGEGYLFTYTGVGEPILGYSEDGCLLIINAFITD